MRLAMMRRSRSSRAIKASGVIRLMVSSRISSGRPSISINTASSTRGSSSFMTVSPWSSGAAAQHADIGGFEPHGLHHPADPQFLQRSDEAGEGGHQVVLVIELYQHRLAQPGDQRAGGITGVQGGGRLAAELGEQMVDRHRYLPLDAGGSLALGHPGNIADAEYV